MAEGEQGPRRWLRLRLSDILFCLFLYVVIFTGLNLDMYRGVPRPHVMATGPSALTALVVVVVVALYLGIRHR